jgi:hypothetical protein
MEEIKAHEPYETSDYALFSFKKGNRVVMDAHVSFLVSAMKEEDLHYYDPIEVNKKMEIEDGQHRFLARQRLKLPVYYFLKNGECTIDQIQKLNTGRRNWKYSDILNTQCVKGNKDYLLIREFMKIHEVTLNTAIHLIDCKAEKSDKSAKRQVAFRDGVFRVKDINKAGDRIKMLKEIGKHYPNWQRRSFIIAMNRIFDMPVYKHKKMLEKLQYQSKKMVDCTDTTMYIKMMEDIYNYKQAAGTIVRFI